MNIYSFKLVKKELNMPNFDKTGPQGNGPLTGRGKGYCNPGYAMGCGFGMGFGGRGRGFGMGRCCGFNQLPVSSKLQKQDLKDYRDELKANRDYLDEELKAVGVELATNK
jgi:uncharacterized protein DUF5320